MATMEQYISDDNHNLLDPTAGETLHGNNVQEPVISDSGRLDHSTESPSDNNEADENGQQVDGRLFTQSAREKDKLSEFRASQSQLRLQRRTSILAAMNANAEKAQLSELKKKGFDGSADDIIAQLKKERTEISMQVSDHKAERLKQVSRSLFGNKTKTASDDFFNIGMSLSKLPELVKACWEVTNFVPHKLPNSNSQSAATPVSSIREVTEDKSVISALRKLFELLEGFSSQNEQFLKMLSEDPEVAVVSVPAGSRAATKGQPMIRSLVLLSGQAHNLSYAGESHILLEESHSTRMKTGDCLGFINDNEEIVQENAFTIICQTSCSFLEIPKSSVDAIFSQMKMERFIGIMSVNPDERTEVDVQFLLTFAKKNAFFKQLKEARQLNLCRQAKMEMYRQEEVLFNEDDRGNTYYIIIRGSVRVSKNVGGALDNQGNKIFSHVTMLTQGVGFGELALLSTSGVRQATITAHEDSVFMTLSRKVYNEVLRSEHQDSLQKTILAVLHVFPYVQQRDRNFQTYIAQLFRDEELPVGHILVEQGAKANTFYILKEGSLGVDCRVEYSRFSVPQDVGLSPSETPFETKTLKKFSQKELKTRVVQFGEMSHFGDTIGDVDMLANPIWAAKYLYRVTVLKPAVVCSISWSALKVRFPAEMLDELRTRSQQKFTLFKAIYDSAVATEFSNSRFCCHSVFNPIGYVPTLAVEKSKSTIRTSIGEMLDGKKMMLRREIRNRIDVPVSEAFQATVNDWIADMSCDNVKQSIEIESYNIKQKTGIQLAASKSLFGNENVKKDKALQALMRSAFMDEENVDQCIDDIIKMTRGELSTGDESGMESDIESFTTSQKLASHITDMFSLNSSVRSVGTPIPGHKPQFVRYELKEQFCNTVEGLVENMDNLVLLDSSVVQTRPSSRALTLPSRSKSRVGVRSRQGTSSSIGNFGDGIQDYQYCSPCYDTESSDASPEQSIQIGSDNGDGDIPEYFYPDHYRIKSSTKRAKSRAAEYRKQRDIKQKARAAMKVNIDMALIATPIKMEPTNASTLLQSPQIASRRSRTPTPTLESNPPLPPPDKAPLSVKSLQSASIPLTIRRVTQQMPNISKPATPHAIQMVGVSGKKALDPSLFDSLDGRYANVPNGPSEIEYLFGQYAVDQHVREEHNLEKHKMILFKEGEFLSEKESIRSAGLPSPTKFSTFSDDEHMNGAACSPDAQIVPATPAMPLVSASEQSLSKDEKMQQILKLGFSINARKSNDPDSAISQALEFRRLVKERAQAETKSKISALLSGGMLDNKIKHLEAEKSQTTETVDFELSDSLLQKMRDVTVRRMNDPNFQGQKLIPNVAQKLLSGTASTKKIKKLCETAIPKTFDFNSVDQTFSNKSKKFEEAMSSSYHNEQMLKIQNRNTDHQKTERQQLLRNVLNSSRGPRIAGLNIESAVLLPSIISASPLQQRR